MVRIDMSEYREQHTVSRLFGAPPGYVGYEEGGQLTEAVRRRPYQIVLFDEIEKAHPDVWNALLQILEDGRLTDGQGRVVDFRSTVLIMTSNIGTQYAKQGGTLGFIRSTIGDDEAQETKKKIEEGLRRTFRPEFLNRIDEIIIFHTLTLEHMEQIVDLQMEEIRERVEDRGITIELTEPARKWLAEEGYDPAFGARPLRRTLQRYVESPLSKRILRGEFEAGDHVLADVAETQGDDKGLVFEKQEAIPVELPQRSEEVAETDA
jgi:ATP-dependent Clp protease ATP-binding subunit ClpC